MIKKIEIELGLPFEKNIERALTLPASPHRNGDEEIVDTLRRLHELAYGRSVQTTLGLIAIAPAVAPSLSRATFSVATRPELLSALERQTTLTFQSNSTTMPTKS